MMINTNSKIQLLKGLPLIGANGFACGRASFGTLTILMLVCLLSGCQSLTNLRHQRASNSIDNDPNHSIAGVQGPTERRLLNAKHQQDRSRMNDKGMEQALADYERARQLYDEGKYDQAAHLFGRIAAARRSTYESSRAKFNRFWGVTPHEAYDPYSNFGDPIEEDAMFMRGESLFAMKTYDKAQIQYGELLDRYPSSRHLDKVTRNLFRIARYWLDFPDDVGESGDASVKLASAEQSKATPEKATKSNLALVPNLTDKSRPLFDTYGRGLEALRSIWLHDATGPLADDALMLSANHHLRTENFPEAARLYGLLRDQYPDSPHFKDAFLLGSHVTLASYQGPAYDGKALTEARDLKKTMLGIFPDLSPEQRERLQREVVRMDEAEVARVWDLVEFYTVKNQPSAVALHCYAIINQYPDSKFAELSRKKLQQLEAEGKLTNTGVVSTQSSRRRKRQEKRTAAAPQAATTQLPLPSQTGSSAKQNRTPQRQSVIGRIGQLFRAKEPPKLTSPDDEPVSQPTAAGSGRATLE